MITRNKTRAIYIHVPFCKSKCPYCDFYSSPRHRSEDVDAYVTGLLAEIEQTSGQRISEIQCEQAKAGLVKSPLLGSQSSCQVAADTEKTYASWPIETVYFGGGTPSLLSVSQIAAILDKVRSCYDVCLDAEISMEVNPATVTYDSLCGYRAAGVNRISIGVQSFDDVVLKILGRLHSAEEAAETVKMARQAGFENVSIDLMFGIAGQSVESWESTVEKAIELAPEHISLYTLEIMDNTRFARDLEKGIYRQTEPEEDRKMYELALDMLEAAGYRQYEISNAAKPGFECRHNMRYWNMGEYIGLGPGASSFVGGVRYVNAARNELHVNTEEDNISEYIFTGLRKSDGISKKDFQERFGDDIWNFYSEEERREFQKFVEGGFAEEDEESIRLTRKGMSISNRIMLIFIF